MNTVQQRLQIKIDRLTKELSYAKVSKGTKTRLAGKVLDLVRAEAELELMQQINETFDRLFNGEELILDKLQGGAGKIKYNRFGAVNSLRVFDDVNDEYASSNLLMGQEKLLKYVQDLYNPQVARLYGQSSFRFANDQVFVSNVVSLTTFISNKNDLVYAA
jgi:hypothetical protein